VVEDVKALTPAEQAAGHLPGSPVPAYAGGGDS
jgi:hypothetical protein